MAAVRQAIPVAQARQTPLEVAFVNAQPGRLSTWGMLPPDIVATLKADLESAVFREAAAVLAPDGVSWEFHHLHRSAELASLRDPAGPPILFVVARHSRRTRGRLVSATSRLVIDSPIHTLAVTSCDHGGQSVAKLGSISAVNTS